MRNLIYILLFFSLYGYGQSKMLLASMQQAEPAVTEYYTTANVVGTTAEANSLTGIAEQGAGTLSIQSTGAQNGTYWARLVGSGADNERIEVSWSGLTIGQTYTFEVYVKTSAGDGELNNWTGVQQPGGGVADPQAGGAVVFFSNTTFTLFQYTLEATATSGLIRVYNDDSPTSTIGVDAVRIYQ